MGPSARVVNHSGWDVTQGWSGAAWMARSSATSMPSSRGRATKGWKPSIVPRRGGGGRRGARAGGAPRAVPRDLQAAPAGARHEGVEVLERPEVGVDGVVAALVGADRPRDAG